MPRNKLGFDGLEVEPYPDRMRARLRVHLAPFEKPPDVEIVILNPEGKRIASASVIGVQDRLFELTMHLQGSEDEGAFKVVASIRHREEEVADRVETAFELRGADEATT